MEKAMITCPECFGIGKQPGVAHIAFSPDATEDTREKVERNGLPCMTCGGSGMVDGDYWMKRKIGKLFHDHRIEHKVTIKRLAIATGVDVLTISRMERGLELPDFMILESM